MYFRKTGSLIVPTDAKVENVPEPVLTAMQKHESADGDLFTHPPCVGDIMQGNLGDCYLLAAMNSILTRPGGCQLIQCIMKDNGDKTVTLRLWKQGQYHYVRVKKTLVRTYTEKTLGIRHGVGDVLHNQAALWPSMLEKAYLMFIRKLPLDASRIYKALEGGAGHEALEALLGSGTGYARGPSDERNAEALDIFSTLTQNLSNADPLTRQVPQVLRERLRRVSEAIFPEDDGEYPHARAWLNWNVTPKRDAFAEFMGVRPTVGGFEQLMASIAGDLDRETRDLVLIWVRNQPLWPGPIGTGRYLPGQANLFALIQRLLATQRGVTAGTKKVLFGEVTGVGHSAGEPKVAGLAGNHEYSILDTRIDNDGLRYIQVLNPWARYGRTYESVASTSETLKPVAVENAAESWIELTDFMHNFEGIEVGPPVHGDDRRALMQSLVSDNPQGRLVPVQQRHVGRRTQLRLQDFKGWDVRAPKPW
jgi:hypothetical protein